MKSIMITLYVVFNLIVTMCLATMNNPPVIDIRPLIHPSLSTEAERKQVQEEIFKASNTWGFFQVLNHGISPELQENLLSQMKLFFHSSQDIKYTIKRTEYNSRGFADDELTKRLKDVKELVDIGQEPYTDLSPQAMLNQALDGYNQWPNENEYIHLSNFKTIINQYYSECLILSQILIQALASSIPCANSNYFIKEFQQHSSFLRLNYYPVLINATDAGAETMIPTSNPIDPMARTEELPRRLGVSRHTDAGALTVLLQDPNPAVTSGLEVYSGSKEDAGDGQWIPVQPVPGALTINTGDVMQVWSNGLLKAPEHRVRPTTDPYRVRYSAPFFYNPNYDTIVTPLIHTCTTDIDIDGTINTIDERLNNVHYDSIRWGDYRNQRFQGDFHDQGDEIQIENFTKKT